MKSATPLSSDLAIDDTITPSIWDKCFVRNLTHLVITVGEGTYYSAFIPIKVLQVCLCACHRNYFLNIFPS